MKNKLALRSNINIALLLLSIISFFPGSYSIDTWAQYSNAVNGTYSDWYGTGYTLVWRLLLETIGSFSSLYFLQMTLYWTLIYNIAKHYSISQFNYWIINTLGIFFLFIPQYVMRDSLGFIFLGLLVIIALKTPKVTTLRLSLFLLISALTLSLRSNLLVAMIPLFYIFYKTTINKKLVNAALSILTPFILIFFISTTDTYFFKAQKEYPAYKLRLLDISGVSISSGENYMPSCITQNPNYDYNKLKAEYTPASLDDLYWPPDNKSIFYRPDSALNSCVSKSWKTMIIQHPFLYLKNRIIGFTYYLKLNKRFESQEYWNVINWIDPSAPFEVKTISSSIEEKYFDNLNQLHYLPIFSAWFWLLLNSILLCFFYLRFRNTRKYINLDVALVQLMGVLYTLSQLLIYQHDRDFRYSYPNIVILLLAFLFFKNTRRMEEEKLNITPPLVSESE